MLTKIKGRKVQLFAALFIILGLLVLLFLWGPFQNKQKRILLGDPAQIDQLSITGPGGSVLLRQAENQWLLSGGEKASPISVENLLFAAGRLQVDAVQDLKTEWDSLPVKALSFYSKEKLLLQYETLSRDGQFLLRPAGSEKSYAVSLPGFPELELDRVFSDVEGHYLDRLLIHLLPGDIQSIKVEKGGSPGFSFNSDKEGELSCRLLASDSLVSMDLIDEEAVRMLFTYFTAISFEEKASGLSGPEKAEFEKRWLANISVESFSGEKHSLKVYSLPKDEGVHEHLFKAMAFHNESPEPLLMKYIYLDVLMRDLPAYIGDNSLRQ